MKIKKITLTQGCVDGASLCVMQGSRVHLRPGLDERTRWRPEATVDALVVQMKIVQCSYYIYYSSVMFACLSIN